MRWAEFERQQPEVADPAERQRFCDAVEAKIGWRPDEPEFHCFAIDIESASFAQLEQGRFHRQVWKAPISDSH